MTATVGLVEVRVVADCLLGSGLFAGTRVSFDALSRPSVRDGILRLRFSGLLSGFASGLGVFLRGVLL